MSERYSRLYSLPENMYASGSPVIISAGALLKDNQTGKVLAQLKLKNIARKTIKAARVSILPFDTIGNPLGAEVRFQYLDLNTARDGEFGARIPVLLPDAATRQISVAVTEVAFSDNTLWTSACITWEPLPKLELLDTAFRDKELIKQYRIEYGVVGQYVSTTHKDLWFCACGAINREQANACHCCRKSRFVLQDVDLTKLQENCNERLAAKAKKAALEKAAAEKKAAAKKVAAEARAKKAKRTAAIVMSAAILVVAVGCLFKYVIMPNIEYYRAVSLLEAEQYDEAVVAFKAMDGYKDSASMIVETNYQKSVALMNAGHYDAAIAGFTATGGYKDSVEQIETCEMAILDDKYDDAMELMDAGNYEKAIAIFEALEGHKESAEQIETCKAAILDGKYNDAVELMKNGSAWMAYCAFDELGSYKDSTEKATSILDEQYQEIYTKISSMVDNEEYEQAVEFFRSDWKDTFGTVFYPRELKDYYSYAAMMKKYENGGRYWFNLDGYSLALEGISSSFKDVGNRISHLQTVLNSYGGVWLQEESHNHTVAIQSDGNVMDRYGDSYVHIGRLCAYMKDGEISGVYMERGAFRWKFGLNNDGTLYIEEQNSSGEAVYSGYNGTYTKVSE